MQLAVYRYDLFQIIAQHALYGICYFNMFRLTCSRQQKSIYGDHVWLKYNFFEAGVDIYISLQITVCLCEMDDDAKRSRTKLVNFFVLRHLVLSASRKLCVQQIVYASEEHTVPIVL
jgi:hypothetical protein